MFLSYLLNDSKYKKSSIENMELYRYSIKKIRLKDKTHPQYGQYEVCCFLQQLR